MSVVERDHEGWWEYGVRVQPHHTDYGGIVWHGTYLTWMETLRVEVLRAWGLSFADLVAAGCDLPVVDLALSYRRSVQMGDEIVVRSRPRPRQGARLIWDYRIESGDRTTCHVTGHVTLVPLDRTTGKILRRLPPSLAEAIDRHTEPSSQPPGSPG